jgi:hypothetical protein
MIANPDLNLDIAASFKSPMNIDRSARDQNTPEGAIFNEIYDKLKDVPEFKALFVDLFNENQDRFNIKFQIADLAPLTNGTCSGLAPYNI